MKLAMVIWISVFGWAVDLSASAFQPSERSTRSGGVVIQKLFSASILVEAGVREGDIFFEWERRNKGPGDLSIKASGRLESPFDWLILINEQAPRGPIILRGVRQGTPIRFRVSEGRWGAKIHPNLEIKDQQLYLEGRQGLKNEEDPSRIIVGISKWQQLPHPSWFALEIANHWKKRKEWLKARKWYENAAAAEIHRPLYQAQIQYQFLQMEIRIDEIERADSLAESTLNALQPFGPSLMMARAYTDLGGCAWRKGDLDRATFYAEQELAIKEQLAPGSLTYSHCLARLGTLAWKVRALDEAEKYFLAALDIREKIAPGSGSSAPLFSGLGNLALDRGEWKKAERYFLRVMELYDLFGRDERSKAEVTVNLGSATYRLKNYAKAIEYYMQAYAYFERLSPGGLRCAQILNNLGNVENSRGNLSAAHDFFTRALEIKKKLQPDSVPLSTTYYNLGMVAQKQNQWEQAEENYLASFELLKKLSPGSLELAKVQRRLAIVAKEKKQLEVAEQFFSQSITTFSRQLENLGGTHASETRFREVNQRFYDDYLQFLLEHGRNEKAFEILEQYRAQTLLRMMVRNRFERTGKEVSQELLKKRESAAIRYQKTYAEWLLTGDDRIRARELDDLLFDQRSELDELQSQIRESPPKAVSPAAKSFKQVQQILDPGTLLLSYLLLHDQMVIFAVSAKAGLVVVEVKSGKAELEEQIYQLSEALSREARLGATELSRKMLQLRSRKLYESLIRPVGVNWAEVDRLVMIADGPLHLIPFSMLYDDQTGQYLIEKKPLVSAVSASVYAKSKGREPKPHTKIVAIGDPVYPNEDRPSEPLEVALQVGLNRGRSVESEVENKPDYKMRVTAPPGGQWSRLPQTAQEVERIGLMFGDRAQSFVRHKATEEALKNIGSDVSIIHIAAHAFIDKQRYLDSGLVLTLNPDFEQGAENGILHGWEIVKDLRLDADLVVLSACQTGLGQEAAGEGLVGLTYAFQAAGARTVLASYWNVHDLSTAVLMERFYQYLKAGDDKATALQKAQIDLIKHPISVKTTHWLERFLPGKTLDASSPFYWAAFQIVGPWDSADRGAAQ